MKINEKTETARRAVRQRLHQIDACPSGDGYGHTHNQRVWEHLHSLDGPVVDTIGNRGLAALEELVVVGAEYVTQTAARQVVRTHRRKGIAAAAAETAATQWLAGRAEMARWVSLRGSGKRMRFEGVLSGLPTGRPWGKFRAIRLSSRLKNDLLQQRRRELEAYFADSFRHGTVVIEWSEKMDDCSVGCESHKDWDTYSRRTRWPAIYHGVTVRAMYMTRAQLPGGQRVHHSLCTLGASLTHESGEQVDDGFRVWDAVWARKTRGVAWEVHAGYMAENVATGEVSHGRTARQAVNNLRRRSAVATDETDSKRATVRQFGQLAESHGSVRLTAADANESGACADGIQAWVARHCPHLDAWTDSITVGQAYRLDPANRLALYAARQAVRNARHA